MVDRPRGYEQALGYLCVAQTFGHERQHLQLPRRELRGVVAGLWPGPARQAPSASLAQPACDDRGRRACTQAVQRLQRLPAPVVVTLRVGERGLVGAAELAPERGRPAPVAGERERIRLRESGRCLIVGPRSPPPLRELSAEPRIYNLLSELPGGLGLAEAASSRPSSQAASHLAAA